MRVVTLQRQKMQQNREDIYQFQGDIVSADDVENVSIDMGVIGTLDSCWDLPLPQCPDCGGEIVWAENGYVPGTRECTKCHSIFAICVENKPDPVQSEPEDVYYCDNGHNWMNGDTCPKCGENWV